MLANKKENKNIIIAKSKNNEKAKIDIKKDTVKPENVSKDNKTGRKQNNKIADKTPGNTKTSEKVEKKVNIETPKRVKFVLKNNSMQGAVDYYKSVRQSPNIPYDSRKQPVKTNLKPSTPSPINPFTKKKFRSK